LFYVIEMTNIMSSGQRVSLGVFYIKRVIEK